MNDNVAKVPFPTSAILNKLSLVLFFLTLLLHSVIVFRVLPPYLFIKYQVAARQVVEGSLPTERFIDFSPLYLQIHVAAEKYLDHPDKTLLMVQVVLSAFAAVFLFRLLSQFYTLSIALLGTFLFVINHSVILHTGTFEPEPLIVFTTLGFLLFSVNSRPRSALLAGIFLGLSLLTRPNFFLLAVVTPFYYWLQIRSVRPWMRTVVCFLVPVVIALSLLTLRNSAAGGAPTPFSMNPGQVLFEGNNPNSLGQSATYPPLINDCRRDFPPESDYRHVLYRLFARRSMGKPLTVPEVNAYWIEKAGNFIMDHPRYFLGRLMEKVTCIFHSFRRHDIAYLYVKDKALAACLPSFPFALISVLALLGMVLSAGAWRERLLIYLFFFTQCGLMLALYVSERQRVAVVAVFIFFAAGAVQAMSRDRRILVIGLLIAALFFPILHITGDVDRESLHIAEQGETARELKIQAKTYREKGHLQLASRANAFWLSSVPYYPEDTRLAGLRFGDLTIEQQALETALLFKDPDPSKLFDLAILYIENGLYDPARPILRYLIDAGYRFNRRFIQSSQPHYYLARIEAMREHTAESVTHLQAALENNPGDPWVLSLLASLTGDKMYQEKLRRYFGEIDAAFFMGRAHYDTGMYPEAAESFARVVSLLPEYRKAKIYLSLALGASGKYQQAGRTYMAAVSQRRDGIFGEEQVLDFLRRWAGEAPHTREALHAVGTVLGEFGHYEEALAVLQKLGGYDPSNTEIERAVRWNQDALESYSRRFSVP